MPEKIDRNAEQIAWCKAVQQCGCGGKPKCKCQDGYNSLAVSVWPYVIMKANKFSKALNVCAEELISEGLACLPAVVKSFKCDRGIRFSTYFCCSANRRMSDYIRKERRHQGGAIVVMDDLPDRNQKPVDERVDVPGSPLESYLLDATAGINQPRRSVADVAGELGMGVKSVRNHLKRTRKNLRKTMQVS